MGVGWEGMGWGGNQWVDCGGSGLENPVFPGCKGQKLRRSLGLAGVCRCKDSGEGLLVIPRRASPRRWALAAPTVLLGAVHTGNSCYACCFLILALSLSYLRKTGDFDICLPPCSPAFCDLLEGSSVFLI